MTLATTRKLSELSLRWRDPQELNLAKRPQQEHKENYKHTDPRPEPERQRLSASPAAWFQEPHSRSEPVIKCYSVQGLVRSRLLTGRFALLGVV